MITLCQQIQAWFVHFREMPSEDRAMSPNQLHSLLFPTRGISDCGFLRITPYFSDVPAGYNWREKPLSLRFHSFQDSVSSVLLGWRAQHCVPASKFLKKPMFREYFSLTTSDLLLLSDGDVCRYRQCVERAMSCKQSREKLIERFPVFDGEANIEAKMLAVQRMYDDVLRVVPNIARNQKVQVCAPPFESLMLFLMHADSIKHMSCDIDFCFESREIFVEVEDLESNFDEKGDEALEVTL